MSQSAAGERRTIHYLGRVQGVGFRYTAHRIAASFVVSGYVENLDDGSVRLVVEGTTSELDRFVTQVEATMARTIFGSDVETSPATGEFAGFEIRH